MRITDNLAKLRASCDRLHNGSCSPCKFDCPLYMNGKCKDVFFQGFLTGQKKIKKNPFSALTTETKI